jgi:hypothetical protein
LQNVDNHWRKALDPPEKRISKAKRKQMNLSGQSEDDDIIAIVSAVANVSD